MPTFKIEYNDGSPEEIKCTKIIYPAIADGFIIFEDPLNPTVDGVDSKLIALISTKSVKKIIRLKD